MRFTKTMISGVWIVDLEPKEDHRGFFARTWCQKEFEARGLNASIKQINIALTALKSGIRGLHFQLPPFAEVKVVRCTRGALFDVAVDIRRNSPTYKKWVGVELTENNHRALYVSEGCAHGYQTLADDTEILYLTSCFYAPNSARGFRFDDSEFCITWPLPAGTISQVDLQWPAFTTMEDRFNRADS